MRRASCIAAMILVTNAGGEMVWLSQWDRKVYDLALKTFLSQSQEEQARSAPVMLLCAKHGGREEDSGEAFRA